MSERSRREKANKADKLAALRRAREGGGRNWQPEDSKIYDEVSEAQYKTVVAGRLNRDDFVVDDGAHGYIDNGMDDFGEGEEYESEDDAKISRAKKGKADTKKPKAKAKVPLPEMPQRASAYRPKVSEEQETDFMSGILNNMDAVQLPQPTKSRKRKPSPERHHASGSSPRLDNSDWREPYPEHEPSSDGFPVSGATSSDYESEVMSPKKKPRTESGEAAAPIAAKLEEIDMSTADDFSDINMDEFMQVDDDDLLDTKPTAAPAQKKPLKPIDAKLNVQEAKAKFDDKPSWLSVYNSLSVTSDDALGSGSASSSTASPNNADVLEPDGSLHFYWLDYLELDGQLYFVGKVRDKGTKSWLSVCVTVENIQRNLFVLPRERRVEQDEDGEIYETDEVPEMKDVYEDFERVRRNFGIKRWRAKFVKRKYAFGEKDVPKGEAQWMKVVYGFNEPQLPSDAASPNFSRIFGTNTSAFELLALKRKIMGPCWLKIKKPHMEHKGVSWCKIEGTVSDPKDINPFSEADPNAPKEVPPLTVMSLSIRTIVNHKANLRELVCVTARIWSNMQIDDPAPPESLPCTVKTFVRPLDRFPPNFEVRARKNGKAVITPLKTEHMLLNSLLSAIHRADPDVVVGHEFLGVSLDVLLHRMRELKIDHWSRIGRFRRSRWPTIGRQGSNMRFITGRLLCDLASDSAKGMIVSTTWSLTEMCKTHLKMDRQDIDPDDTATYFDSAVSSPDRLLTFVHHCELDAHYQMALAAKVQILPLTRQLTNLAGNAWNKTLNGGRAERNEYILLHEFHRLKYICPDKLYGRKAATAERADQDDEEGGKTKSKRDKYKGGLVFDPKRGLWDKFILVMDFNSLYPSIIQEYNIDFTTVDQPEDEEGEEKIPEVPGSETSQGVLPRLIATLVQRRRQVKSLMKDRKATPAQLLQWDIKQMALKLTANSMYGCLGFEYSRFYARPLAALTTFKGREILTHTRELAESLSLDVVYGDTDSVFVNSNVTELPEALKISAEFKKAVNDRYKLLEIDLDGIFQRLLLLQKKKYAAIKVEDGGRTSTEVKGLDMKRREYCALSKAVSQYVLDQILSGDATEVVVERIHEYLTTMGEDIRAGKVKLDEFIVFKRLGKNPEDYPDAKNQPHVQVALRMKARGGTARSGDVIPYVFCVGETGETGKTAQAERAKHPDEVRRASNELKIDYEHYLSQQILPPIERLCEPIEGTDRARLAECLGLDSSRYRTSTAGDTQERAFSTLDSLMSDSERFRDCVPFTVRCRGCQSEVAFDAVHHRETSIVTPAGPTCPACKAVLGTPSLRVQLEMQIRERIGKYYEGWMVCDDPTCGNRTRMMGVYGRRCLRQGCRGTVQFEYSDAELYTQLRYYHSLFSEESALKAATGTRLEEVRAVWNLQAEFLRTMTATVNKYLDQSGRRWVDLTSLFSFMKV